MIDLHMHTTASDGRLTSVELAARASAARLTTISVTDHDTVAAIADVTRAAQPHGIRVVPGIEITAVEDGRDVHLLGYFFDPADGPLSAFLVRQRELRVARVREIAARLSAVNVFVDVEGLLHSAATRPGSSVGRPQIARQMVRSGQVSSVQEAFDVWLAAGRPAFVPRSGPAPAAVVDMVHAAGGVASFAHPGVTKRDDLIEPLVASGLDAIEIYHSDHAPDQTAMYRHMATRLGVLVSGGSDFHGDDTMTAPAAARGTTGQRHRSVLGAICLPQQDFEALEARSRLRRSSHGTPGFGEAGS